MFHVAFVLWCCYYSVTVAQFQGLMCRQCNDVYSPKYCQDTTICGQGEICFAREFTNHEGLRGFHLGCEDYRVITGICVFFVCLYLMYMACKILQQAHTLIGKRDVTHAHPETCYECCSSDGCNSNLCQGTSGAATAIPTPATKGVKCMSCADVASPDDCRQTMACGSNEICFTREFVDYRGRQGYALGCESQARCDLFLNAKNLFGKRQLPDSPSLDQCYSCCSSDECNSKLCHGTFGSQSHELTKTSTSTSVPTSTSTVGPKGCTDNFVSFHNNCYLFESTTASWAAAQNFCESQGADLLTLHSREENSFVEEELRKLNATHTDSFWTLGIYSNIAKRFVWTDGSPMNYTNWYPSYPTSNHSMNTVYRILITNPIYFDYKAVEFFDYSGHGDMGIICKMPIIQ